MPTFQVIPTDGSSKVAAIIAPDAGRVLQIVARLDCQEADVLRDGEYRMTIRLGVNGLWSIFERDDHAGAGPRSSVAG